MELDLMRHGSHIDPPNRYNKFHLERDLEHLEWDQEYQKENIDRGIEYIEDNSQTIVSENNSPDIPFRYSLNPYRGCIHACAYCYARPSHEYLGFNAGIDFETKIVVKKRAADLFRDFLSKKNWTAQPITFSGVTDCYQPAERTFQLTRQCLEVALECRQPISIVTKNALVLRDLELLRALSANNLAHVYLSLTSLDPELARDMEPRTSIPSARLRAIQELAAAGIPVGVMTAPLIPGLNDSEIPQLLHAAKEAGAVTANYVLLRLPLTVEQVFIEWVQRNRPNYAEKIVGRLRSTRDGKMNSSKWGERMVGHGEIARQIQKMFLVFRKKYGLDGQLPAHNLGLFRPPKTKSGQLPLF
jgi:DNA repair photolyase